MHPHVFSLSPYKLRTVKFNSVITVAPPGLWTVEPNHDTNISMTVCQFFIVFGSGFTEGPPLEGNLCRCYSTYRKVIPMISSIMKEKKLRVGWDAASVMSHTVHLNYNIYFPVREQVGWDRTRGWAAVRERRAPSSGREAALQHYLNFFLQVFNQTKKKQKKKQKALFLTALLSSMFHLIRPNLSICAFSDCKE